MDDYSCPPPQVSEDGTEYYEVEKIVDQRHRRGVLKYKVRWKGYPSSEDQWKNAAEIEETCPDVIEDWNLFKSQIKRKYSRKSRTQSLSSDVQVNSQNPEVLSKKRFAKTDVIKKLKLDIYDIKGMGNNNEFNAFSIASNNENRLEHFWASDVDGIQTRGKTGSTEEEIFVLEEESRSSSLEKRIPKDMVEKKILREMVEEKEVEIQFCDVEKQSNFEFSGTPDIFVFPDFKFPLKNLELSSEFSNVVDHYRRTQTDISDKINHFEQLVFSNKKIWKNHAFDESGKALPESQIAPCLPESYRKSDNSPEKVVENFLEELMGNIEKLCFFQLAKEFGKMMVMSPEGSAGIRKVYEFFEAKKDEFGTIEKEVISEWCPLWNNMFRVPTKY
ncbi:hypothetical protein FO519_002346 [Halicephalobus sp. NKZ332]|nr:hypothetical protein FO519_002346 [Halicephalobus sp. NKZ332]